MGAPWNRTDCTLDVTIVRALVTASAPSLCDVAYLDEGWDSWVYTARDGDGCAWILRFPKRAAVAAALGREIALLPELAPTLPLPVPRFELVGAPGTAYPHRFVGYRRLSGDSAMRAPERLAAAAPWRLLGRFLAALHSFPVERAVQLGVAPAPSDDVVLVHADFAPEHLLLTDAGLSGVIDWGDVALGDPADDLGGVHYAGGDDALAAALAEYVLHRPLPSIATAERARAWSRRRALDDLAYGRAAGRPEYLSMARRALSR